MRILVVLDGTSERERERVVAYVAGLLDSRTSVEVHLLLVLPPTPPEYIEFGSLDEMDREAVADAAHTGDHARWVDTAIAEAHPAMTRAKQLLREAGVPVDAIHEHYEPSTHTRHVAQHALDIAQQCGCDTIALNHHHFAWSQRWLHTEPGGELLRRAEGMTLWFVG